MPAVWGGDGAWDADAGGLTTLGIWGNEGANVAQPSALGAVRAELSEKLCPVLEAPLPALGA